MSVDLYERYKDALRRGHMAQARGQFDAALEAYREAIAIAPDRATPHAGVGHVLLLMGVPVESLAAFDASLARAPRDEIALRGRSDALAALGRRTDAAESLDVLSDIQEAAGRIGQATDSARRALDLAEQKARRRRFQDLTRRLRLQPDGPTGDATPAVEATQATVARAADVPTGDVPTSNVPSAADHTVAAPAVLAAPDASPSLPEFTAEARDERPALVEMAPTGPPAHAEFVVADAGSRPVDVPDAGAEAAAAVEETPDPAAAAELPDEAAVAADEPDPEPDMPRPDPGALVTMAEASLDAGDMTSARLAYLAAAAAFDADGSLNAALDACYVALAFAPDDADVHLQLVDLYLELGWNAPAADKLALLGRLTELDGRKDRARARIIGLAADRFPDDPRFQRMTSQGELRP